MGLISATSGCVHVRCSECIYTRQPLLPYSIGEKQALKGQFTWPNLVVYFSIRWIRIYISSVPLILKETASPLGNCTCLSVSSANDFLEWLMRWGRGKDCLLARNQVPLVSSLWGFKTTPWYLSTCFYSYQLRLLKWCSASRTSGHQWKSSKESYGSCT